MDATTNVVSTDTSSERRHISLTRGLTERVDAVAQRDALSFSAAVRRLIALGLRVDHEVERRDGR